jgi:hypothetical protein
MAASITPVLAAILFDIFLPGACAQGKKRRHKAGRHRRRSESLPFFCNCSEDFMLNTTAQPTTQPELDLKQTIGIGKLRGFWKLMTGYPRQVSGLDGEHGRRRHHEHRDLSAAAAFVDNYMMAGERTIPLASTLPAFLAWPSIQAVATFNSRRLAAKTAEGIARRIREYHLRPHPAAELHLSRQDADG